MGVLVDLRGGFVDYGEEMRRYGERNRKIKFGRSASASAWR